MTTPIVIHIPHASVVVPDDVAGAFLAPHREIRAEILRMTDWFTDELFAPPPELAAAMVAAPVSRLVVDTERFRDDSREAMASRGMGAIYTRMSDGRPLRTLLSADERAQWLARWYDPHHEALTGAVGRGLERAGRCLIVDAHSFPSAPLPYEPDQTPDRPDICLGVDPFHTPSALRERARRYFEAAGLNVDIDRPFAGTITPQRYYGKSRGVASIMIEVNRRLYMDEATGLRGARFDEIRAVTSGLPGELAALFASP
jgi:N-formylglutamate deformylase